MKTNRSNLNLESLEGREMLSTARPVVPPHHSVSAPPAQVRIIAPTSVGHVSTPLAVNHASVIHTPSQSAIHVAAIDAVFSQTAKNRPTAPSTQQASTSNTLVHAVLAGTSNTKELNQQRKALQDSITKMENLIRQNDAYYLPIDKSINDEIQRVKNIKNGVDTVATLALAVADIGDLINSANNLAQKATITKQQLDAFNKSTEQTVLTNIVGANQKIIDDGSVETVGSSDSPGMASLKASVRLLNTIYRAFPTNWTPSFVSNTVEKAYNWWNTGKANTVEENLNNSLQNLRDSQLTIDVTISRSIKATQEQLNRLK